ncbi:MAG: hypothetical protein Kow0099_21140 [Candidatus Abyssubacteria bacterium]
MTMALAGQRRTALLVSFLTLSVAAMAVITGCSAEDRARRSLKKVEYKEINQFNKYYQREVKPKVFESQGQFYRVYHERVDPHVTMRRTNSIDTPYIATVRFTENIYLTKRHPTMKEGIQDTHFILSGSSIREIIYAYVNGEWKKKETY